MIGIIGVLALGGLVVLALQAVHRRRDRITPEEEEWHPRPPPGG